MSMRRGLAIFFSIGLMALLIGCVGEQQPQPRPASPADSGDQPPPPPEKPSVAPVSQEPDIPVEGHRQALEALEEEDNVLRWKGVRALVRLGEPAVPDLIEALSDNEYADVRASAASALGELGVPEAVAPLAKALADDNPAVRKHASSALGQFGTAAQSAVPDLKDALADPDPEVRDAAKAALDEIQQ